MPKKWLGKVDKCELCGTDLNDLIYFVDGRTKDGPWGLMCEICHGLYGVGLGTGKGQKYDAVTKEKIDG